MSKELKIILLALAGIFVLIQFIPANKPANEPSDYDFFASNMVPADIELMIRTSCFDCHSQEVKYPWYAHIAPSSWLVARDIRHGRHHLDLSKWNDLDKRKKLDALDEISDEVKHGDMPMPIYTIIHTDAKLTQEQRNKLIDWADDLAEKVFEE